jgi:glucose-6-phosphate-specific signal transduction histidine kinase
MSLTLIKLILASIATTVMAFLASLAAPLAHPITGETMNVIGSTITGSILLHSFAVLLGAVVLIATFTPLRR